MNRWWDYWRAVGGRISWDRSLLRGLWVVPWLYGRSQRRPSARPGSIAFYPQPGLPWYTLPLAMRRTAIRQTRDLKSADAVMMFDDRTRSDLTPPDVSGRLLNLRATDISKQHVGDVFRRVFGYDVSVDPCVHIGPMVEKADVNGVHDGRIVKGPLETAQPGQSYQRLVESVIRPGVTEDLRCVCVGGKVAVIFRKEKAAHQRFSTVYLETTLCEANTVLSAQEQAQVAAFCHAMGLDFGSIDILRDHAGDGRIYIVDVNKTCMPVLSMAVGELDRALGLIGAAVEDLVLGPAVEA